MSEQQHVIQHPLELPIELELKQLAGQLPNNACNLKLICYSTTPFPRGASVSIHLPSAGSDEAIGTVEKCSPSQLGFQLRILFSNFNELMQIRMLEQICYIQRYKSYVRKTQGRSLSDQDAAFEWIEKYATIFPSAG